ncbi:glycerophosphoryl diester phosphodiesterase membrane domain-containing protein [Lysinibacillus sp. NPDC048646]|uniref:glycerophosphoryl diester phosphodiesterase membrane domain-containing protein n=1 Tax=Lysinibacillus sp. NPDC048646 TaxID=3390574 RepID=UPI003D03FEB5
MHKAGQIIRLAIYNIYMYRIDYIQVFALIRLFQFLLIVPVTTVVFKLMLRVTGYTHITEENIQSFLAHPFVIGMILIWVMVVLLFIYYEMGFLFLMAFNQQRGIRYRFLTIWQQLNRKVVYFYSVQVIYLIVYIALLLPLASFMLPLTLTQAIAIPHFMTDELMLSRSGKLLYAAIASVLGIIGVRSILTLPIFTIQPRISIRQSFVQSWRFSRRGLFELLVLLAMILTSHLLLLVGITVVSTLPLFILERVWPSTALLTAGMTLAFLEIAFVVLFSLLQAMFSQVMVAITYNTPLISKTKISPNLKKRYKRLSILVCIVFIVLSVININSLEKSVYAPDTKIIAHRGYTAEAVENTIGGLVRAAAAGADLVELDIQQTEDGEFVVFHDRTLRRLAGKNGVVTNMTLSELKTISVHSDGYSDKISSLDDFIEMAKALDVALLIELKVQGNESEDLLPSLVKKLKDHQVLDTYYVQSASSQLMTQLKKLAPNLRVGIVYALTVGSMSDATVDFIALEESWVSDNLIAELQQSNMDLFVWTLNKDRSLQEFIGKNVAGVITDHPDIALDIRTKQSEHQYFLQRVLHRLQFVF